MIIIDDIRIKDNYVHNLPENKDLLSYARENRRAGNMAEIAFWKQVHKKMFHGLDFDRQKVIGNYIVDFFVKRLALVIEIDGGSHNEILLALMASSSACISSISSSKTTVFTVT